MEVKNKLITHSIMIIDVEKIITVYQTSKWSSVGLLTSYKIQGFCVFTCHTRTCIKQNNASDDTVHEILLLSSLYMVQIHGNNYHG